MMDTTLTQKNPLDRPPLQFKGSLFSMAVLSIDSTDLTILHDALEKIISQAPNLFTHAPIILDLSPLQGKIDFGLLLPLLKNFQLIPVALMGGTPHQQAEALAAGLAQLPPQKTKPKPIPVVTKDHTKPTKIISQSIRSGQQIYAEQADLIVLGSVGHGAEILADGHIHIYGTLNGRAIAGAKGNEDARIFCRRLDADLISIAGIYALRDDYEAINVEEPKQILLVKQSLKIMDV